VLKSKFQHSRFFRGQGDRLFCPEVDILAWGDFMARQSRKKSESGIYHIICRGINKQNIFEDDEDRKKFLETLEYYKRLCNYLLYGYCLMDNHIHLLIKERDETISQVVKRISANYVHWYNEKYERCGHLFQERFKSETIESEEYFLTALRYIHQNPVKAGIVQNVSNYLWSSYQEYDEKPGISDVDFALGILSNNREKSISLFKVYTNEKNRDECLDYQARRGKSDEEVMIYLYELGIKNICQLQQMNKQERDDIIRSIKVEENITVRQLARIIGISKSVIARL